MNMLKKIILVALCIVLLIGYDFTSKKIAKYALKDNVTKLYLGGTVQLIYVENTGGMLSLGSQLSTGYKFVIFIVIVPLILAALFVYTIFNKRMNKRQIAAAIMFISGGLGNWLDRILNDGKVADFIIVGVNGFHTGVFNMADMYVTACVILLLISNIFAKKRLPA